MKNNKVIVVNHCRRPRTSRMCLNHLTFCSGIKDYTVLSYCEPGNNELIALIQEQRYSDAFKEHIVVLNDTVKGGTENQRQSLSHGFELSDYVIFVEDDILFWRDALEYHEFCSKRFYEDKDVFNITLVNNSFGNLNPYIYMYSISKRRQFSVAGLGLWKDRFDRIGELGLWDKDRKISMDCHIGQNICGNEIYPKISRCQNIGAHGQYVVSKHWHVFKQYCVIWAESYKNLVIDKTPWVFDWENELLAKYGKESREAEEEVKTILRKYGRF